MTAARSADDPVIPGKPQPAAPTGTQRPRTMLLMWRLYCAAPLQVAIGLLCTVLAATLLLQLPTLAGDALAAGVEGAAERAAVWSAWFTGYALLETVLRRTARRATIRRSRAAEAELRHRVIQHLEKVPVTDLDRLRAGDIVSRLTQDIELLRFATGPLLLYGLQALVLLPGGLIVLLESTPQLALAAALPFAVIAAALGVLAPRLQRESRRTQEALGEVGAHAGEVFSALRFVRAAHRELQESARMVARSEELNDHKVALAKVRARGDLAIHLGVQGAVLIGLWLGGQEVLAGRAEPAQLLELYALLGIALSPLLSIGFMVAGLPRALAAAERIDALLALPQEEGTEGAHTAPPASAPLMRAGGRITTNDGDTVLQLDELQVAPGEFLGVVGPIGSGKSSLVDAVMGFRSLHAGQLTLDGRDARELGPSALRSHFALVAQEPFLFADTLAANLRLAKPEASDAELRTALAQAALLDEVDAWPEGLATRIGERGITLSGGQRQRTALARALLAERPVLVLDDALSAVDQSTERRILGNLQSLRAERRGTTWIVISHRMSALANADRIAVLEEGRITACAPPDELLRQDGFYRRCRVAQDEQRALDSTVDGTADRAADRAADRTEDDA